jgi:hypothetical protein
MSRITRAWRALEREQRLAAVASIGLFVSMFLPWYSKTDTFVERGAAHSTQTSLNAFEAFSFVEAAVLLVSAGVLAMLFARAEGRAFQLPGGDGLIVMIAGGWSAVLIFYRLLDKPTLHGTQRITATVGVEWGIFLALLIALGLVYAGARMRASEAPEPPRTRPRADRVRPAGRDAGASAPHVREGAAAREPEEELTMLAPPPRRGKRSAPVAAEPRPTEPRPTEPRPTEPRPTEPRPTPPRPTGSRPRYPPAPAPPEQMSFEDPPPPAD